MMHIDYQTRRKIYSFLEKDPILCKDIQSFVAMRENIRMVYETMYREKWSAWMMNDLCRFYNDDEPIMNGYTPRFFQLWNRVYGLHPTEQWFDKIMNTIDDDAIRRLCNQMFATLDILERRVFFRMFIKEDC